MKNALYELISTLDTAEERISELEDIKIGLPKLKSKEKKVKKQKRISKYCGTFTKVVPYV